MTYPVFWKAIFTALAVSLCGAAHAASWSSARLTDLKITLVDLDPNDGITPAVSINLPGSPTSGYAELGRLFDEKTGSNSFDPLSLYLSNVSGYTEASISGSGPLTGMDLSADARVSDLPPGSGSSYSARVTMPRGMDPRPEIGFGLTLTPMTRLIWSADGVAHSELDADGYGYAYAGIQIHPHNVPASAGVTIRSVLQAYCQYTVMDHCVSHDERTIVASFFNLTHASVDADAQAWAYVQGRAEAVPAPTSFALLLGGLFCLGGVVRQRRSGWGCKEVASAAACAVGLLVATGAQATSWSSATLSNLHLTLVDLDLNDGIAPAVMIDAGSARSFVSADAHDFASGGAAASKYGTSAFDPVSVAVSHGTGSASAALSGNGPMLGMALNTSGSTSGYLDATSTDYERQGFYAAKASTSFFQFTLTPMTRLIWSGDAVISAERNAPPDFDLDSASAAASLAFNNLGGPAPVGSYDNISVLTVGDPTNHIAYDERRLEVSFFNLSTLSATATGWANVQVDGYAMGTSVVPEPATPLLWLMGIAAVAGRRYRHS